MTVEHLAFWRRVDRPGHEAARLVYHEPFWQLGGTAVFAEGGEPCRLEYTVLCDSSWRTLHARISGWWGRRPVQVHIAVTPDLEWRLDGRRCPEVSGCVDLDLSFSPATNVLPVRRLALEPGQESRVRAAWLVVPEFALRPLDQSYRRIGAKSYHYEAPGERFTADLELDDAGFVRRYPELWEPIA